MFTGIVLGAGRIRRCVPVSAGRRLEIELPAEGGAISGASGPSESPWSQLEIGESIAVSGVCLTLVEAKNQTVSFDVIQETLRRSQLGRMRPGDRVNLERALRVGDRLGGHYVTGHVDATGKVERWQRGGGENKLFIQVAPEDRRAFRTIPKGSVAIDGVSLTVVDSTLSSFSVALIPHTLEWTSLGSLSAGDGVNLEMDHVGKWVQALVER